LLCPNLQVVAVGLDFLFLQTITLFNNFGQIATISRLINKHNFVDEEVGWLFLHKNWLWLVFGGVFFEGFYAEVLVKKKTIMIGFLWYY
jgi:hypothetical protein